MKTKSFNSVTISILIFVMTGLFHSCEGQKTKKINEKTKIEIDQKLLTVDCSPSTQNISFSCSANWEFRSSENWLECKVRTKDKNKKIMTINITQNCDTNQRQGYVFIEVGDEKDSISIIQKGNDQELTILTNSEIFRNSFESYFYIEFCALQDWTITSTANWITIDNSHRRNKRSRDIHNQSTSFNNDEKVRQLSGPKGIHIQRIRFNYNQNSSFEDRKGEIIIKTKNRKEIINITQQGREIKNRGWYYSDYNSQNIPTCMEQSNEKYVFNNEENTITFFENNRRLREYIYETKLEDPRLWDMSTKDNCLIKEYKYTVEGVLYKAVYTNGKYSTQYYAEVDIDATTGKEETHSWEIYQKNTGLFDDIVLDTKYDFGFFSGGSYTIYEIDKSTGTKKYLTKIGDCDNCVKSYVLDYLKKL